MLVSAAATAAEPWICTADGTRLIYEESVGGSATGTLDKLVTTGDEGEILLTYTREGLPVVERWTVHPDSTVLHIEAPEPMYELLRTMQVEDIEFTTRNQSLPATMTPGDEFPGFGFTLSGWKEGERSTVSVVSDRVRVVGRERIKTPAGKFEAVRIEYRTTTTMGDSSVESRMTQWLVPGIGVVRQEIPLFGDMAGVTELQKIIQ
ncbi:hypothetical protein B5G16_05370 [Alistipes sp. An66]|nr:hypothetical protein B5G16_05370 [Alistipes sp. An66]